MTSEARSEARRAVEAALADAPREFSVEVLGDEMDVVLFAPGELDEGQIGYAVSPDGESLIAHDGWHENWLVIGRDADLGDPVIVDLDEPSLPVYTAPHGMGVWELEPVADSLDLLLERAAR